MSMEHHAYFYEGPMSVFRVYQEALEPFWAHAFEQFGVDDARELRALASLKHDEGSLFLVGAASITSEAQQALLKLFEEPQQGITFVLIVSHGVKVPDVSVSRKNWNLWCPAGRKRVLVLAV